MRIWKKKKAVGWFFGMAIALVMSLSSFVAAQEVQPANRDIEAVISSQIEAFKADDFARAFTFASPSIQGIFGSPERFGAMVKNGYPMVWRPSEVRYGDLREIAGALWQRVDVVDQRGNAHSLDYRMVEGPEGWKISGVQLLKAPDVSV